VTRERVGELWRAGQAGWPARFPLAQFPNAQLAAGLIGSVVADHTEGRVHDYASAIGYLGLGAWAADEMLRGVNWFRRLLGAAALVVLVVRLATALHRL
jgi:hypothetical protein